jgi:acetyl-CoA decarbonylase/synthase complex subunit gamma
MGMTGLQILKLLPKTNCKECGSNTCLAFALKLAAQKADLADCPYASDEAKEILGAASEPPVKGIQLGKDSGIKLGEETVLYRHEKTFVNQTALAVNINDIDTDVESQLNRINNYNLERVGEEMSIDMVAITQKGEDSNSFVSMVQKVSQTTQKPLVINSSDARTLELAARVTRGTKHVLASANSKTLEKLLAVASENGHGLAITAPDLDELVSLTAKCKQDGFNDIILHYQTDSLAEHFQINSIGRHTALKQNYKPLGYPVIRFIDSEEPMENMVTAMTEILKYGSICVLPYLDEAELVTLMTLRLNIYTDPQKPIQVEPKIYPIGEPKKDDPVFVTTNFSLTYFIVSGEIENSGTSGWLVVPECEGMSVLTAWAAGKFSGETIGKFAKENDLENKVSSRQIVIPGYVAQISGELEENLPGWKVLVGPQEAADIESFIKARLTP